MAIAHILEFSKKILKKLEDDPFPKFRGTMKELFSCIDLFGWWHKMIIS